MRVARTVAAVMTSAAVARAVRALPEPTVRGWQRENFRGRPVSLSGGLAAAVGALAGTAVAAPALRVPALVAGTSALLAGGYDDLVGPGAERPSDKGLGGHLDALRTGRLSGGVIKVVAIGAGALGAAAYLPAADRRGKRPGRNRPGRILFDAAIIAASANLLNLFDLRPGRAAKVAVGTSAVSAVFGPAAGLPAAVLGAGAAVLVDDLAERTMLGDLGANTLGALIGVRLADGSNRTRALSAIVLGALTLASERVSFSKVIEAVPALRWLDQLGRMPASAGSAPRPT